MSGTRERERKRQRDKERERAPEDPDSAPPTPSQPTLPTRVVHTPPLRPLLAHGRLLRVQCAHTVVDEPAVAKGGEEMRGILSGTGIKYYEELRTSTSTTLCPTSTRSPHNETNPHRRYQAPRRPMCARHILILVFSQGWSREVFPLPERRQRVEMRIMTEATTATTTRTIAPPHHTGTSWHVGRRTAASIRVVGRCSRRRIRRQE